MPAFSTKQYAFSDIRVVLLGRDVVGLQGISYSVKTDKQAVYGRGNEPLSIQSGNKEYKGTIMLLQSEVQALETAIRSLNPTYDLTSVPFDIVVTYGDGAESTTDVVQGVEITEYEKGMKQEDKFAKIDLPFLALGIKRAA